VGKLLQQEGVAWLAVDCKAVVLCCVVLCCVVLCCAVLCCVVLCCAVLCCVVLCCVEFPLNYWNMCCVPAQCQLLEYVVFYFYVRSGNIVDVNFNGE
jgi:hypothetical protein